MVGDSDVVVRAGSAKMHLYPGTIQDLLEKVALDAVVSSDDSVLSMGCGVSAALRELAGRMMVMSRSQYGPRRKENLRNGYRL